MEKVLEEPEQLDRGEHATPPSGYEEGSACWLDDDTIVIGGNGDEEDLKGDQAPSEPNLSPRGMAVYDLPRKCCIRAFELDDPPGTMWAVGKHHVLSLYRHPKLIDLRNGSIAQTWDELASGMQITSITRGASAEQTPPPMAFDLSRQRLAIANGDVVTVLQFSERRD